MSLEWRPDVVEWRDGTKHPVERATLAVGDAAHPILLPVARLRAVEPRTRTIVFLAGGPGDSGIGYLSHPKLYATFDTLRQTADVVLFDQRGCGLSEPRLPKVPATVAYAPHKLQAWARQNVDLGLAPLYTTERSVDDLAALIDALGGRCHLLAHSYGTHLAMAFMRRHPKRIGRLALLGCEGPDQTWKTPSQIDLQLRRVADVVSAQTGQDLIADLERALDRPEGRLLRHIVASWLSLSHRVKLVPELVRSFADTGQMGEIGERWAKEATRPVSFYWIDGASGASPHRLDQIAQDDGALLEDAVNDPFPQAAKILGANDLGEDFRTWTQPSSIPCVAFTGAMDGNTPTENVEDVAPMLPRLKSFVVADAFHNDLLVCESAIDRIGRFFAQGTTPRGEFAVPPIQFSSA